MNQKCHKKGATMVRIAKEKQALTLKEATWRAYMERWQYRKDGEQTLAKLQRIAGWLGEETPVSRLDQASVNAVKARLRGIGSTEATRNRYLAALKTFLRMAHTWGELSRIPSVQLTPETPERRRALTDPELQVVLAHLNPEVSDLVRFLHDTGLRLGEALKLTAGDIRDGCVYLTDTKSGKPRVVPLTKAAMAVVEARKQFGRLFNRGKWYYARHFKDAVKRSGINPNGVCLHALRHTCCTNLVARGAGLAQAGAILGHSAATMTSRYTHLDVATLKKAVELLDHNPQAEGKR